MNVELVARALHEQYERAAEWKFLGYRRRSWEEIDQTGRAEHVAMVQAVLDGEREYRGTKIPTWVKDLVHEEMGKQ